MAIHGDESSFWNRGNVYHNLGFDDFLSIENLQCDEMIGMGLSDVSMFRQSAQLLSTLDKPFYAFIITLTSHMPFVIPEKDKSLKLPTKLEQAYLGNYYHSIHYLDRALGEFTSALNSKGLLKDSVIIVYGDHAGIRGNDKKIIEQATGESVEEKVWVREYSTVPWILYNPGITKKRISKVGGHIDIYPTIMHLVGENNYKYALGDNLFVESPGSVIVPRGDYNGRELYINGESISNELSEPSQNILRTSDTIIRSNYFLLDIL